jgi:hypothetical protein
MKLAAKSRKHCSPSFEQGQIMSQTALASGSKTLSAASFSAHTYAMFSVMPLFVQPHASPCRPWLLGRIRFQEYI